MKLKTLLVGMATLCGLLLSVYATAADQPADQPVLKTERDRVNYSMGINLISNFRKQGIDIDLDKVVMGMKDALAGNKYLLSDEDIRIAIYKYQTLVRQNMSPTKMRAAAIAEKQGVAFLKANKTKEGVITLPSGLQYKILKAGEGKKPADADAVEINYRGTFINGNEFDSSAAGKPATFKLSEVIPGWKEALKLMPVGSKWQIFIPTRLAYGRQGKAEMVGPNETLIYEIELLGIK
ncbi:MAG: FKBP-type peptidyl-prolyl cis-trans isomerase [Georgfuchsia sp.]